MKAFFGVQKNWE